MSDTARVDPEPLLPRPMVPGAGWLGGALPATRISAMARRRVPTTDEALRREAMPIPGQDGAVHPIFSRRAGASACSAIEDNFAPLCRNADRGPVPDHAARLLAATFTARVPPDSIDGFGPAATMWRVQAGQCQGIEWAPWVGESR